MSRSKPGRKAVTFGAAVIGILLSCTTAVVVAPAAAAAANAPAHTRSGIVTLSEQSGPLTGKLTLGLTPAAGAGAQICDPDNESYAVVYAAAPGDEYGVAGASVNYTILAPEDGSTVPAGGTLTAFLPTVVDPDFPATGGNTPLDATTHGTFSLGVRCQDDSSDHIFQNYWTTITVDQGTWTVQTTEPTTTGTATTATPTTGSGSPTTSAPGSTTTTPPGDQPSGSLRISPDTGSLLSGTHTLTAVPTTGAGTQVCGDVQSFAVLYFAPIGSEYAPAGAAGVTVKSRPLQAAGLDVPVGGSLAKFLTAVGPVDFSQSLGASESWQQTLAPGRYSLGVRCQSGTQSDPTIYQNYFTTVTVASDGSWAVQGAAASTTPTTPTTSTTASTSAAPLRIALFDSSGTKVPPPLSVTRSQQLFVAITGLAATEKATVTIDPGALTLATGTGVNGQLALPITIPATAATGTHTLTVTGAAGRTARLTVNISPPAATTMTGRTTSTATSGAPAESTTTGPATTASATSTATATPQNTDAQYPSQQYSPPASAGALTAATVPGPYQPVAAAAGGATGPLAHTGFPISDSFDLAVLLLGVGVVVLCLAPRSSTRPKAGERR